MKSVLATLFSAIALHQQHLQSHQPSLRKPSLSTTQLTVRQRYSLATRTILSETDLKRVRKYVDEFKRENSGYRVCLLEMNYQKTDLDDITIENKAKCKR